MNEEDILQLGGSIELSGFSNLDGGAMIVLKKIIGNYARKMSDQAKSFENLSINMKTVHDNQFELHAKLIDQGKAVNSSVTDRNVFLPLKTLVFLSLM